MPKVLPVNAVEVSHHRESFCLVFRFLYPDGAHEESVFISISPAGAKTAQDLFDKEMQDYERETGVAVEPWNTTTKVKPNGTLAS